MLLRTKGRVAQRITRLTTDQKIPGSNPGTLVTKLLQNVFNFLVQSGIVLKHGNSFPMKNMVHEWIFSV